MKNKTALNTIALLLVVLMFQVSAFAADLEVTGDLKVSGEILGTNVIRVYDSTVGSQPSSFWHQDVNNVNFRAGFGRLQFEVGTDIQFKTDDGSGYEIRMVVKEDGDVGIGTISPDTILHVNGAITLEETTEGAAGLLSNGTAQIFAKDSGGKTRLWGADEDYNKNVLSPHAFDLYTPSGLDVLPWSYYSENNLVGKKINVDMSGAIRVLEQLSGQQFIYVEDLPAESLVEPAEYQQRVRASKTIKAKTKILMAEGERIEISIAEAWQEVTEVELVDGTETVTKYDFDLATQQVTSFEVQVRTKIAQPTGNAVRQLKPNVEFDRDTGKFYLQRTVDDIELPAEKLAEIQATDLPKYIKDRLPVN